jgi:hypothetical protein
MHRAHATLCLLIVSNPSDELHTSFNALRYDDGKSVIIAVLAKGRFEMFSMLLMFFAPVVLVFVVMLAVYAMSQMMDEPTTEPHLRSAHCPHCHARIKQGWKACPTCGEKLV